MAHRIDISLEGLHQLLHRIERKQLEDGDWALCAALVLQLILRTEAKQKRMLAKLGAAAGQGVSGMDAEYTAVTPGEGGETSPALRATSETTGTTTGTDAKQKAKGHGRNGAAAFVNAKHFVHALTQGLIGALCAACGVGRMTRYREKVVIRVVGQPLFASEAHHLQQARCRVCGKIVRAQGPPGLLEGVGTSYIVYDYSACAFLLVMHYLAGAPFKRLESLHQGWGVPLADANQWNVVDASDDFLLPLHKALERHGIEKATTLRIDDTGSKVIALMRQIQAELDALKRAGLPTRDVRTGINATGVYFESADGTVILFYTGRHHAGEMVDRLLAHRKLSAPKLVKVTDGASKNFDHGHKDKLLEATCNAHAFLKFRDVKDKYPDEYAFAGEIYSKVFDNDDAAKAKGLTPLERMQFHRQHSKPLMEKLKARCEERLKSKQVEPNSPLWEPLSFILNQWPRLTQFYEVPGVPLDTNLIEQKLIIPVRYLAGSFNYQTETGAEVGDRMMSLIATAQANGVEPVAYLTHCLRNHENLAKQPEAYLPWAYRERLHHRDGPPAPAQPQAG